ncbi:MAG: NBR1-Ig-like domain-containing protein [Armatimonadota bacterium]|nr:NBR1-Ig-like domain-containing protein [Armatimonadota bacterium]
MKRYVCSALLLLLAATAVSGQVLVLDEPLATGFGSGGTTTGGSFTGSAYRIDAKQDSIYWHLPHVVRNGYAEMTVTGMDALPGGWAKYEIFHAYNSIADTSGYDSLDYKMYFRKENTDKIRTCLAMGGVFDDTTSTINPGWAGTHTLKFQWASTTGSLSIWTYWDGNLQETKTISAPGWIWDPPTMSVRVGASSRGGTTGAIVSSTYSNLKVYDNDLTPAVDDSMVVSDTIPSGMTAGQPYDVTVTMRNAGTATWTAAAGYKLAAIDDSDPFCAFNRVDLAGGDSIAQNQQKAFNFTMTAPSTPGTYTTDWQMLHDGMGLFGGVAGKQVQVYWPDSAQYLSDTIPTAMTAGLQYNVSVTMRNTSNNTWTQASVYKLGAVDDSDPMGPGRVELDPSDSIGNSQQKTFNFSMVAPGIAGTYTTDWRMVHEGVVWFGDTCTKQVDVDAPESEPGLVLYDTLLDGSHLTPNGSQGGAYTASGWQVTGDFDYIFWHLPYPVYKGAAEWYISGLTESTPTSKDELFHMYDYTFNNSDYVYSGGYRDNPYKHFLRKNGATGGNTNAFEWEFSINQNYFEIDTVALTWNPANNYRFREEWGPDGDSHTYIRLYRDGVLVASQLLIGSYTPLGHSVRIAASNRGVADEAAPNGAVYSYMKVWDMSETVIPAAPAVIQPGKTLTVSTTTPVIKWKGDIHSQYQVRVSSQNDPNIGVIWDSGPVSSSSFEVTSGALPNQATCYPFVRLGTTQGWSNWSLAGYSFVVDTAYVPARRGPVRVVNHGLEDDGGKFLALGFTHMKAMHRCKYDRPRYLADLSDMAGQGFNYQRILSVVSWVEHDMEITPIDFVNGINETVKAWPDYDQQLRDTIDIAYDVYGIRTEITIFAASDVMPNQTVQYAQMDRVLAAVAGREHKVILIEVANEYYQNGPGDLNLVRSYGAYLNGLTSVPVSLSAPGGSDNANVSAMYGGSGVDISTVHYSRDTSDYGWYFVRQVWDTPLLYPSIPPVSNNEPIGPGSSVAEENDPTRLCSQAAFGYIADIPMYVYHCKAGIQGYDRYTGAELWFRNSNGFTAYSKMIKLMPPNVLDWTRNDGIESAAPFTVFLNGTPNVYGPGSGSGTGCYRNIGAINSSDPDEWVCYPMGVQTGGVVLQARRPLTFNVYNVLTGALLAGYPVSKNTGENITLPGTATAYLIKSVNSDIYPPGPVTNFTATPNGTTNNLSWTNPTDLDFAGTMVRFRTDSYPSGPTDGTLVCNRTALPGSNDSFAHNGVNPSLCYYYAAYAYDEVPGYSMAALASTCAVSQVWLNEIFDNYSDGNLGGQGGWVTMGASSAQVQSAFAKGGTGKASLLDPVPTGQSVGVQIQFTDKSSGYYYMSFDLAQEYSGTAGQLGAYVSIYGSSSSTPIATLQIQKSRLFVEYGSGTLATISTTIGNLNWYNMKIGFNVDTRKMDLWLDGSGKGTNYAWKGTGTNISRILFWSDRNMSLSPQKTYIDNVKLEPKLTVSSVTDDGSWSPSLDKLHFSITPVAEALQYQYAIGTTSGGTQVRGWTDCGASTDYTASGLALTQSTANYYIGARASMYGNWGPAANTNGIKVAPGLASIQAAKALPDGAPTDVKALRGKIVTGVFPGSFYIQEPGSLCGLEIVSSASVAPGNEVDVCGVMSGSGAERYLDTTGSGIIKTTPGPGLPNTVILPNASIGGAALNSNTLGVVGGIGPNNVGLYATAYGAVTQRQTIDPKYFYIDDGSGLIDGTTTGGAENVGIRVIADPASYPEGCYVAVEGISSCFDSGGLRPLILPMNILLLQP